MDFTNILSRTIEIRKENDKIIERLRSIDAQSRALSPLTSKV